MGEGATELTDSRLEAGWSELGAGRWNAAFELFEGAVATAPTPEGFEGLSWAAWWLDREPAVFEARGAAFRLYQARDDDLGAARMAIWLACDQLDFRGAVSVASGWLARARRLLEDHEPAPEHGWLAFFEGYFARAGGDDEVASDRAAAAAAYGRTLGVPDLEMLGLALEGVTLVSSAQLAAGMRCLDEAAATALEGNATIPISGAWACCFLVSACSEVRDYARAAEWCAQIAEFADHYGSRYMLAFCRAEYGAIHLWQGHWRDAESELDASVKDFEQSRPAMAGAAIAWLAELRRRQGRADEATAMLDRVGPSARSQLCKARLALDRGDAFEAAELGERLLRQVPADRSAARLPGLELLIRARIALGELSKADAALEALRVIQEQIGTAPLRASSELAEGMIAAAREEHDRARLLLEDAVDRFERCGGPYEAASARVELAASLLALGRGHAARAEASEARRRLLELGAARDADRARRILDAAGARGSGSDPAITPREREVLGLLSEGLTNRLIAERLGVSEHTIHRHVTNILRKLDLPSRAGAAAHAVRHGLHEPPPG
jgi:DNA-binding CsgD family transcriptional regulator